MMKTCHNSQKHASIRIHLHVANLIYISLIVHRNLVQPPTHSLLLHPHGPREVARQMVGHPAMNAREPERRAFGLGVERADFGLFAVQLGRGDGSHDELQRDKVRLQELTDEGGLVAVLLKLGLRHVVREEGVHVAEFEIGW